MEKKSQRLLRDEDLEEQDEDEEEDIEDEDEDYDMTKNPDMLNYGRLSSSTLPQQSDSSPVRDIVEFSSSSGPKPGFPTSDSRFSPPNAQLGNFKVRFTAEELELLEEVFKKNQRPSKRLRTKIAHELNLPPKNIRVWFQNRRAKAKKTAGSSSCTFAGGNKSRKIRVGVNFDVIRSLNEEEVKSKAKKTETEKIPYLSVIKMEDQVLRSSQTSATTNTAASKSQESPSSSTTASASTRSHFDDPNQFSAPKSKMQTPSNNTYSNSPSNPYTISSSGQNQSSLSYSTPPSPKNHPQMPPNIDAHNRKHFSPNSSSPSPLPSSYIPILPASIHPSQTTSPHILPTSGHLPVSTSVMTASPSGLAYMHPATTAAATIQSGGVPNAYSSMGTLFGVYPEPIRMSDPINARDQMGCTPIMRASEKGDVKEFTNLLKGGADVRVTNLEGDDPLLAAIKRGYVHIIDAFVSFVGKRQINMITIPLFQRSLLHVATAWRQMNICKYLLENGADLRLPDLEGKTALDVAVERNYSEMIILFNQYLGMSNPTTVSALPSVPPPVQTNMSMAMTGYDPYMSSASYYQKPSLSNMPPNTLSLNGNHFSQYQSPNSPTCSKNNGVVFPVISHHTHLQSLGRHNNHHNPSSHPRKHTRDETSGGNESSPSKREKAGGVVVIVEEDLVSSYPTAENVSEVQTTESLNSFLQKGESQSPQYHLPPLDKL